MISTIVDYTIKGACSRCGQCCSNFLPVSDCEIDRIRQYIKQNKITVAPIPILYADRANRLFQCPFYDDGKKQCLIYPVRPNICKSFLCSKDEAIIWAERTRAYLHSGDHEIDMRATFFNARPVIDELSALMTV